MTTVIILKYYFPTYYNTVLAHACLLYTEPLQNPVEVSISHVI